MEHRVKLVSKKPFVALVPSEMLMNCDTLILMPFQETCKKGHKIKYAEEHK